MTRREILRDYRNARQLLELESDDSVLYIQRLRIAGDAPLMLENNYYSLKRLGFTAGGSWRVAVSAIA